MRVGCDRQSWRRLGVLVLAAIVVAIACRSDPTPRTRGRGEGAAGEPVNATTGVPTACTDEFRKGGLPIGDAPRKGSADPLVAIVEFANLECPDCAKAARAVDEVLARFGDDVALYFIHAEGQPPVVKPGEPAPQRLWRQAAQASLAAARQDKFWPFVEQVWATNGKFTPQDLESFAQRVGLDLNAYRSQQNSRDVLQQVDAGQGLAVELGITGPLPVFWVNGTLVQAAEVEARLGQVVEQALAETRQALLAPRARCEMLARQVVTRRPTTGRGAAGITGRPFGGQPQEDPNALYRIPIGDSPKRGAAEPLATLFLFTDFQCPHCARVAATLDELARAYPDDLRLVFKNNVLPGHDKAQLAHEAAMAAAQQGKFWEMHDALFAAMREYYESPNRDPARPHPLDRPQLEATAQRLGLDMDVFRKALDNHATAGVVQADVELARRFAISSTPTFVLNGRKFSGTLTLEQFKGRVEQALAEARKMMETGVPRAQVYDRIVERGAERAVFLPGPAGDGAVPPRPARAREPPPLPPASEAKDVQLEPWTPTRGPAGAKVTMVVFCEYLCPFCKRVQETLKILQQAFGNDLRIAFRHHIVHEQATSLSLASLAAAKQGKFEELHALFFENQPELQRACYETPEACRAKIDEVAGRVAGLDLDRLHADMDGAEVRRQLEADKAAAREYGARGTPSLFLNGRLQVGASPPSWFGKWIDELLGRTTVTIPASMDPQQGSGGGGGCGAPRPAPAPQ
ncbi:MAG: thioredoxin domain-containing protein, partial [Myxococcales bacterium]|nr:thioredoxin domain-containing protein [Myxococcales bacterium]